MKKLFGKVLAGAVGAVMALSMNAFAAGEITGIEITPVTNTGKVVISGTITGDAVSPESTILVAPENTSLAEVDDANIKYIDQMTAQNGKFSYEFTLEKGVKYNVWFGATDIAAAEDAQIIDLTSGGGDTPTPGTYKIIGTVTLSAEGAHVTEVTAKAGEKTVNAGSDGKYELQVAPGKYEVVVGREGYLYKTYSDVEVTDKDVDLGTVNLLAGNVVDVEGETSVIDLKDLQPVLDAYRTTESDEKFNVAADFDDNEEINLKDLQSLLNNYRATAE